MATAPVTPAPKQTFLQHVGSFFKDIFKVGTEVAAVAEPIVDLAFPEIAALYNSAINAAMQAESAATAAGQQNGSGPQKLSFAISAIEPIALQWLSANKITMSTTQFQTWLSAVVDTLNMIPARLCQCFHLISNCYIRS